ncbi:hypothetical protein APICC_09943 [Apis cerana cerana]|uniref:Chitin-binding type-2 domain-containing protein n=1 Tax=Apis cerana cerana TaxID=94128 RepID=A0A2A3EN81_APICC|nr:hypothetical protein APICC_09943 [Apis cerana cerana]
MENEVITEVTDDHRTEGLDVTTIEVDDEIVDANVIKTANNISETINEENAVHPRRRKVLLRRRPVTTTQTSVERENRPHARRRKVIKRLRPVQNATSTTDVVPSTEQILLVSTVTPEEGEEVSTTTDASTENLATVVTVAETVDFAMTLETPTTVESVLGDDASSFDFDPVTMASTIIDNVTAIASESTTEEWTVTETDPVESTPSKFSNDILDEKFTNESPTIVSWPSSTLSSQSDRRLEAYNRTYYLDSRYVRRKFVGRRPVVPSSPENFNDRNSIVETSSYSSASGKNKLEGVSKRRKNLFVRRRPVSSSTSRTTIDEDDEEREPRLDTEEVTSRSDGETSYPTTPPIDQELEELSSRYTTTPSIIEKLSSPLASRSRNATLDEDTSSILENEDRTLGSIPSTGDRSPEIRPRYRVPVFIKKTLSTENVYPLDSNESEEADDPRSRHQNFRQPRTRYKYREIRRNRESEDESIPDATQSPSYDSSTQVRTRFYARRPPLSTTEAPVTETLIPAKKFDYAADAHRRQQQSLRTTTSRNRNEDSTTLTNSNEERAEIRNLVEEDYTTTPSPQPLITRLVTSVEESGTTERQKILIKTKYSSLTSTTKIPLQATLVPLEHPSIVTSSSIPGITLERSDEDESVNEIRQSHVERSTLPIESEFLYPSRFTTESHESSTIEIESVANTEVNRLPTLKELIGYQTNNYIATGPSPVFLNLFPLTTKSEEVLSREKNVDRVLEQVIIEKNTIFNDTELRSWNKHDDGIENDFQSNLTVDGIDAYYVEDDTLFANKKRIDREDSSEIDLKPTTMRGIPLINLLHSQVPRGFYVTKSEVDSTSKKVKIDALTTELTTLSVENNENIPSGISEKVEQSDVDGKVIIEHDNAEENLEFDVTTNLNTKLSMKNNRNGVRVEGRVESTSVSTDQVQMEKDVPSVIKFTEISIPEENVTTSSISISLSDSSPSTSQSSNESDIINSTTKKSLTNDYDTPSILNIVIPITTISSNITTDTKLLESNVTELRMESTTHSADLENSYSINSQNRGKSTKNDEEFKSILSTTTLSSTSTVETSVTDRTINVFDIQDEKIKFTSNYEFGHKFRRRGQNRYYVNRLNKDQENSTKVVERRQNSRRKIIGYRRPLRRPVFNGKAVNDSFVHEVTTLKETKANDSKRNLNDWKDMNKEGTNVEKRLMSKANQTGNEALFDEEHLRIKENIDRSESEVNSSKNTVTSRTPGNLSSTRLRKPTAFTLTPLQSKTTNTFANHRKTHLTDGKLQTVVNETLDTVDERTETSKPEKDIDQNSRAQEIAVTLADPPSVQSSTTGRPSLRNALKRKISTTVAPRTDATTSRASLRFTPALSDRQKPRTKDKTHRNSTTTRPRQRPPVVDYDYYEDEEEPVIGKSTFNGKLFLTSKGTFRCLDQGNFPHPYSCKKFITCARMVNGLVIGAEYTCPDRLSFDPVGGICNWSAGLGCKE